METSIQIRTAGPSDHVLLAELGRQTFYDAFAADNTPEDIEAYLAGAFSPQKQAAELADPGTRFLIAELDGEPVGYARLRQDLPPGSIPGERPVEIVRFYSRKEWIGRGVGAALMHACLDEARRRGCDTIWLDVWEQNPRAIAFYKKWGFEIVGKALFTVGADIQHDLLMARPVES